jgi:Anti-sigma-K factor rskA, C-terminal
VSEKHDTPIPAEDCCGDAAIYLLGLLDEQHSDAFLEHVRRCSVCSDELAALTPAVDALPATVPQLSAPADVKRHVMSVVRDEATEARSSLPRDRGVCGRFALRRPALALVGAGLLAAGVTIGGLSSPFGGGSASAGRRAARVVSAAVTLAGASATLHQSAGHTWLTVSALPAPSSGHVYEVWVKYPGRALPQPTDSLFAPTASGSSTVDVPGGLGASEVLVTQEPDGGSPLPTTPPVIVAHLS